MPDVTIPQERPVAPLTEDQVSAWRSRLAAGQDVAKELVKDARDSRARVTAKTLKSKPSQHTVVVPLDYASLEQKKANLFKVPEIIVEGKRPEAEAAAPLWTAVTNHALSPQGVNATEMMFEVQPDVLIAGFAVTKIGYENVVDGTRPVATGEMAPDPAALQPGSVLGLGAAPMQPVMVDVPHIISETYYWRRIPPGFLRAPSDFRGSNFDRGAWISWRFCEDVPDGERHSATSEKDDEFLLVDDPQAQTRRTPKRWGTEVWYYASRFDLKVKHPEIVRTFKLYDDEPVARDHRDSPFQRWKRPAQPVMPGQPPPPAAPLSPSYVPGAELVGMKGFPIHVLTLRYLSDTAFPMSDVQMGIALSDEISVGRTQLMRRRDRSLPQTLFDQTRVTPDVLSKLERNDNTGLVGVPGDPREMFFPLDKGQFGRENFAFNEQAQQDYDKVWAHGAHGGVIKSASPETATKSNEIRRSIDARFEAERLREVEWFIAGVEKLMSLYQVFADQEDYVRMIGENGAARLEAWDKTKIPGPVMFSARPNSHIRLDAEADYRQEEGFFNLAGNAPEGNRTYMLQRLAGKRGMDPTRAIQQPPPKTPEPPKLSLTIKMEDFVLPQGPITAEIAQQLGIKISPQAIQLSQAMLQKSMELAAQADAEQAGQEGVPETEHGGAMIGGGATSPINQHAANLTGGMQGIGVQ